MSTIDQDISHPDAPMTIRELIANGYSEEEAVKQFRIWTMDKLTPEEQRKGILWEREMRLLNFDFSSGKLSKEEYDRKAEELDSRYGKRV